MRVFNASSYLLQARRAEEEMEALARIARECGGTVGEGAFRDSITFDTDEQLRSYLDKVRSINLHEG